MSTRKSRKLVTQYLRVCRSRPSALASRHSTGPPAQTIPALTSPASSPSPTIHVVIYSYAPARPALRSCRQHSYDLRALSSHPLPSCPGPTLRQRRGAVTDLRALSIQQANAPVGRRLRLSDISPAAEEVEVYLAKALPITPPDPGGTVDVREISAVQGEDRFIDLDKPLLPAPRERPSVVEFRQVSWNSSLSSEVTSTVATGWSHAGAESTPVEGSKFGSTASPRVGSPTHASGGYKWAGWWLRSKAKGLLRSLKSATKSRRGGHM